MTQDNLTIHSDRFISRSNLDFDSQFMENTQAVRHDTYDDRAFDEAQLTYKKLGDAAARRKETLSTAPALFRDVFYAFHKPVVQLIDSQEMAASHLPNRRMLEQMLSTTEFQELHHATANDEIAAAIATVGASTRMLDSLDKATTRRINELARLEEQLQNLMTQAETLENLAREQPDPQKAGKLANRAANLQQQAREATASRDKLARKLTTPQELGKIENAARQAVRGAITQAEQEIGELNEAVKAYSGGFDARANWNAGTGTGAGPGSLSLNAADKVKLAIKVKANPKLQQIAEVCGRFTRIALTTQKNKVQYPPDEIVGIKTGNNLAHLVTSELALLADPVLEIVFYARYAGNKLLEYELDSKNPRGAGQLWSRWTAAVQ